MNPKTVIEIKARRALTVSRLHDLDYSLNPYLGCSMGCIYCYAPSFTNNDLASRGWGEVVLVKINLLELLSREVARLRRGVVGVSIITDPYMPIEGKYRLTRRGIEILLSRGFRVSIHTKSPLVLRDLDILERHQEMVDVGITITTIDRSLARVLEPGAPHPRARLETGRRVAESNIEAWFFIGPVIPGVNDSVEHFIDAVEYSALYGIEVYYSRFNPYPVSIEMLSGSLDPSDLDRIRTLSRSSAWWKDTRSIIESLCRKYGARCREWSKIAGDRERSHRAGGLDRYLISR